MKHEPIEREPETLRETLRGILVRLALAEPDRDEREAKVDILKKDGWL